MSLITLTSKDSPQAYNYDSYFPQPIKIDRHSQVCVLKFIHFKDTDYIINETNDTLFFVIGLGKNDAQRQVKLIKGNYKATDLATHIATRMNAVIQQQNYEWSCSYAPINDQFTISYASVASPSADGGDFAVKRQTTGTAEVIEEDPSLTETTLRITGTEQNGGFMLDRGIHMNAGEYRSQGLRFLRNDTASKNTGVNYTGLLTRDAFGLVRNAFSFEDYSSPLQDIYVIAENTGLVVRSYDPATGIRILRRIPLLGFQNGTPYTITNKSQVLNTIFRPKMTLLQGGDMKVVLQMEVSIDGGASFTNMTTTETDRTGATYFRNYTDSENGVLYPATFFVSSEQAFYDSDTATQAKFCSARCPYKPTQTIFSNNTISNMTRVDFTSGSDSSWTGDTSTNVYDFIDYVGANPDVGFQMENLATATAYFISKQATNLTDVLTYDVYASDTIPLPAPLTTLTYVPTTGKLSTSSAISGDTSYTYTGSLTGGLPNIINKGFTDMITQGIFNAEVHSISKQDAEYLDVKTSDIVFDSDISYTGVAPNQTLARTSQLFVGRLTSADIATYKNAPAFLTSSTESGDIQLTIGAKENIYVGTKSSGQTIFTSDEATSPLGRSTTLHISIAELPVKSYEGGKSNIGKSIAVLPREEFKGIGTSAGRLVYVADFENWIDLSNASDLYLNQFKVEIRNEDGTLAKDLIPETMLQIKIRKNPDIVQKEMMEKIMGRKPPVVEQSVGYVGS